MSKLKKRAVIFTVVAIPIVFLLYFIANNMVIVSGEVSAIDQDLLRIDSVYHNDPGKSFSPEIRELVDNSITKLDTLDITRVEYLKAKALRFKAIDLYNQGKFEEAFKIYKAIEAFLGSVPSSLNVIAEQAHISNLLGLYYENILKNYGLAASYHQKQFDIYHEHGVVKGMITAQTNLGTLYKSIHQFEKAEQSYLMVDSLWKTVNIGSMDSLNYIGGYYGQSKFFRDLGKGWARIGHREMAQKQFSKSMEMSRFTQSWLAKLDQNKAGEYQAKNNGGIGLTYLLQENKVDLADSILYYFNQSKTFFDQTPDQSQLSIVDLYGKIALGYSLKNECEAAQQNIDQGMELLTGEKDWSGENYPTVLSSKLNAFAELSYHQAKVSEICGRKSNHIPSLEKSLQQYIYVLSYLEKIRIDYPSPIAMEANGITFSDFASEAIQVALLLKDLTGKEKYISIAFELSEKLKSFLLRNAASFEFAQFNYKGEKKELWEKEKLFKHRIIELVAKNAVSQNDGDALILARRSYADFIDALKNADLNSIHYSYYLDRFNDEIPSINYIQHNILKAKEALIEYQWIGNKVIAFVISKNEVNTVEIEIPEDFHQIIFKYSESIKEDTPHFEQSSSELFQTIFQPLLPHLNDVTDLIMIRDKDLNNVVFQTLLTEVSTSADDNWKEKPYLMEKYNIVYTYSLASKVAIDKLQKNKAKPLYEMGVFVAYPAENYHSADWGCGGNTPLSFMESGMRKVTQSVFDSTELIFPAKATAPLFVEKGINCKISHFILHGCFSVDNHPLTNYLQFTPMDENDGRLTTADIYNLPLKNQLAVLSSCKTADGQQRGNEGLQSIARAFYYSGCPTVVAALDNLEDEPTSILLSYFYKNLFAGQEIHVALKNAKKGYLEKASPQNAHPKYWANIICIGNTDPLF